MTLPYLLLKLVWMSGSRIGLIDPTFGRSTSMHLINAATVCLDVVALALAVSFGSELGQRVSAYLLVPPMWIGAGLLGQVLVMVGVFVVHHPPVQRSTGAAPMADWVYLAVYADFCGLGVCLLPAFTLYARDRWPRVRCSGGAGRALQLGTAVAAATAAIDLGLATTGSATLLNSRIVDAIVLLAAIGAAQAFRRYGHRAALVLAFAATGACVAWSCYDLVLTFLPNELVQTDHINAIDSALVTAKLTAGAILTAVLVRTTHIEAPAGTPEAVVPEPVARGCVS